MGNIGPGEVAKALQAVEESLRALGVNVPPGSAVAAAAPHLPA
jgi:aspartate aminotransferase-like enzyme